MKLIFEDFSKIFLGKLLAEGKSCSEESIFKGKISLSMCAEKCDGSSSVFAYALNAKGNFRCNSLGCNCYCITGASSDGTCYVYHVNVFYNVYAYRRGNLAIMINLILVEAEYK